MQKITYNAEDLAQILGISKSAAYDLFHREEFSHLADWQQTVGRCDQI